jgi:hypothetical protein
MSSLESIAKEYDSRFKDFQDSTYLFSLDELPDVFEGEPQTRLVGVGIWETDLGTPAGFHINALIDESEDELEIREAKRGGHVYRKGFRGRYGIGIR